MNDLIDAPSKSLEDIRRDVQAFPRLQTYSQQEAISLMAKMVFMAAAYRGYNVDKEQIAFIASTLYFDLMADEESLGTRHITFDEIGRVFKRAELFGMSVKGLYDAILDYIKNEGKKAAEAARVADAQKKKTADIAKMEEIARRYAHMMEEANRERKV